jgi:hypothetical protein
MAGNVRFFTEAACQKSKRSFVIREQKDSEMSRTAGLLDIGERTLACGGKAKGKLKFMNSLAEVYEVKI